MPARGPTWPAVEQHSPFGAKLRLAIGAGVWRYVSRVARHDVVIHATSIGKGLDGSPKRCMKQFHLTCTIPAHPRARQIYVFDILNKERPLLIQ